MKKVVYLLMILLVVNFVTFCQGINSEKDAKKSVKGGYTEKFVYEYDYKFGQLDENSKRLRQIQRFDSKGNEVECVSYKGDGSVDMKYTHRYDSNTNMIEEVRYKGDGSIDSKKTFEFNANSYKTKEKKYHYHEGNINDIFEDTFVYNKDGYLIQSNHEFRYSDMLPPYFRSKSIYLYDNNDNMIGEHIYTIDDSLLTTIVNRYDKNNNLIEHGYHWEDGTSYKFTYKYDDNGYRIELCEYLDDIRDRKISWLYDENGNIIESFTYDKDGVVSSKSKSKFDRYSKEIEKNQYNSNGTIENKYVYRYDSHGNITEEIKYNKTNEPTSKTVYIYK